jgi:RNA polymerase sigma-70 factor (ECF subfamily)
LEREYGMDSEVWCLLPAQRAEELRDPLNTILAHHPDLRVVVEQRDTDRRLVGERRRGDGLTDAERRMVRNDDGRRVAGRRAEIVRIAPPSLPDGLAELVDDLIFVRRIPLSGDQIEDADAARLMIRLQSGDPAAFVALYERYHPKMSAYARRLLGDQAEAEDTAQEVFMKLLAGAERFEVGEGSVGGWLLRVTRNRALDHLRKHSRVELEDAHEIGVRAEQVAESADHRAGDREFFARIRPLPNAQKQVLTLRYAIGLPTATIAHTLKRTPASVRQLQHRGLAGLAVAAELEA